MAYISTESKQQIAAALKKCIPKSWRYSLAVRHNMTAVLTIYSAPHDLTARFRGDWELETYGYVDVNPHWLKQQHDWGDATETMHAIVNAMNTGNYDNSDVMTDYFDIGHYVQIKIGSDGRPFVKTAGGKGEQK